LLSNPFQVKVNAVMRDLTITETGGVKHRFEDGHAIVPPVRWRRPARLRHEKACSRLALPNSMTGATGGGITPDGDY
jgi:hypothetical protein